jgi:hypothetical protein
MNSHEYDVEALDELFRQALVSERQTRPPRHVWRGVLTELDLVSPRLWQSFIAFFHAVGAMDSLTMTMTMTMTMRPVRMGPGEFSQVSPFVGAMLNQMLDLRMKA